MLKSIQVLVTCRNQQIAHSTMIKRCLVKSEVEIHFLSHLASIIEGTLVVKVDIRYRVSIENNISYMIFIYNTDFRRSYASDKLFLI